jgi:hypothetical protein
MVEIMICLDFAPLSGSSFDYGGGMLVMLPVHRAEAGWARARGLKKISRASRANPSDPMTPTGWGPISGSDTPLMKTSVQFAEALITP